MNSPNIKIEVDSDVVRKIPFNFEKNIKFLLKVVPSEHILNLEKIIITFLSPERKQKQAYGFYCGKREGFEAPTIIICAANLFRGIPKFIFHILPFIPRLFLADTLYHEIAHHYQRISHGYKKEKWEKSAKQYSRRMSKKIFLTSRLFKMLHLFNFIFLLILKLYRKKHAY